MVQNILEFIFGFQVLPQVTIDTDQRNILRYSYWVSRGKGQRRKWKLSKCKGRVRSVTVYYTRIVIVLYWSCQF